MGVTAAVTAETMTSRTIAGRPIHVDPAAVGSTRRQENDVAFPSLAGPLDDLLIPFNPARTLETISGTLKLYAMADPKVAAAQSLMEDRLESLPEADQEAVLAVFWATYRRELCAGARPSRMRDWLSDGDRVLSVVQVALDSFLRPSALAELAEATRQLESSDDADTSELDVARTELTQLLATDIGPIKILPFLAGVATHQAEKYLAAHPSKPHVSYPDDDD